MPGLFQTLEIGRRALLTQQAVLQTIGHNIANVDTPGYSRQRVRITPTFPETNALGQFGTGVSVADVRHVRDLFLGRQFREANKELGSWTAKERTLRQIESFFNEPGDNTLGNAMNRFFDAWSDLSTNPDATNRRALINRADELVNYFHQLARQLDDLYDAVDRDLAVVTEDINRYTAEIARLNEQIASQELAGDSANDLRDKRDLLIDQLSELIDVRTIDQPNGTATVLMGAMMLVDGNDAFPVEAEVTLEDGKTQRVLKWEGTDIALDNTNGRLAGLLEARDRIIPSYRQQLDELARTIVEQVNELHRAGYGLDNTTGVDFFDPSATDAATIRINTEVRDDINKIAAAAQADGYGQNALAIAELRNLRVMSGGTMSVHEFYTSLVGGIGIETQEAQSFTDNFELLRQQVENSRQSVQGVSLDEEMANMVKAQQAYNAAARVITSMDQALDTLIRRTGVVGR